MRGIGDPPITSYTIADGVAIVGIVQALDMRPEWQKLHPSSDWRLCPGHPSSVRQLFSINLVPAEFSKSVRRKFWSDISLWLCE